MWINFLFQHYAKYIGIISYYFANIIRVLVSTLRKKIFSRLLLGIIPHSVIFFIGRKLRIKALDLDIGNAQLKRKKLYCVESLFKTAKSSRSCVKKDFIWWRTLSIFIIKYLFCVKLFPNNGENLPPAF